jgi:hypothetical protein
MVPIIDHTMTNRIVNTITRCFRISKSFIADKEIKVLYSSFGCKMAWFTRNGRSTRRCRCRSTCRNCSRENTFAALIVESAMANGGHTMKDLSFLRNWKMNVSISLQGGSRSIEYIPYFRVSGTIIAYDGGENRHCCQYSNCDYLLRPNTVWFQLVIQLLVKYFY